MIYASWNNSSKIDILINILVESILFLLRFSFILVFIFLFFLVLIYDVLVDHIVPIVTEHSVSLTATCLSIGENSYIVPFNQFGHTR